MKIYSKILFITLPLIVIPALIVSVLTYQISLSAIKAMAKGALSSHLANAITICNREINTLKTNGDTNPLIVADAQAVALNELKTITFSKTGYTFVLDKTGFILLHPTLKYVRQNISGESWFYDIYSQDQGTFTFRWEGENRLANFKRIPDWGWLVISSESESELLGPVDRLGIYIAGLLVASLLVAFFTILFLARQLIKPIHALLAGIERIRNGELAAPIEITTNDEIGTLANAFNSMTDQLRGVIGSLEQRVTERTIDMEHRALQLQAASEIAQEAVSTHDLATLLDRSVNLIQERFNLYHVNIYSPDEQKQYAVLRAGAGEIGKIMVQRGLRVRIGDMGIVSQVAGTGEHRVVNDVSADFSYVKHSLLPDTACAAALPMKVGDRIIGVLEVESQRVNAFSKDIITVLQTLADQLAVALENAHLLDELRTSLQETRTLNQRYTQESWSRASKAQKISGYQFDLSQITSYTRDLPEELHTRLLAGHAIPIQDQPAETVGEVDGNGSALQLNMKSRSVLIAPLILYDHLIGVLGVEENNPDHVWSSEETALLEAISNQVSLTLDNARLVEETQLRAARDRMVAEITNKMRRAVDMDTLIQTAVREITHAINVPEAFVQLGVQPSAQDKLPPQPSFLQDSADLDPGPERNGINEEKFPSDQG